MTISATHLTTSGSTTGATSYNTASISPTGNSLVLACVWSVLAGEQSVQPSLSGNGLTWVAVDTDVRADARLTLFQGRGASPSASAVTINFAGQTQARLVWSISEFSDAVAVRQSVTEVFETESVPSLDVPGPLSENAMFGALALTAERDFTSGSGFTELAESASFAGFNMQTQWRADGDSTVDWSLSASGSGIGVAAEIGDAGEGWGAVPLGF